jgi:hypothetical protein
VVPPDVIAYEVKPLKPVLILQFLIVIFVAPAFTPRLIICIAAIMPDTPSFEKVR